jgi:hypothetical protein
MKRLLILVLPLLVLLHPAQIQGQTANRAGVVVRFSDGRVQTSCVAFNSESISGLDLLQRTGLDVIAQNSGGSAAVCKIGADGCAFPAEPCFCKFGGGQQGQYWAYWRLGGGAWQYSAQGASSRRVTNGDVDGWAWGSGSVQSGALPPVISFEQICPAAPVEPTSPPRPTAQPTPQPTARPTQRPAPRPTARPSIRPTARPSIRPTARPSIRPTARPSVRPSAAPTAPILAEAPTNTPQPPTATALPTNSPTIVPTTTTLPTNSPTIVPTTTAAATPTDAALSPTVISDPAPELSGSNLAAYAIFGAILSGLLGAIGLARWRRRR